MPCDTALLIYVYNLEYIDVGTFVCYVTLGSLDVLSNLIVCTVSRLLHRLAEVIGLLPAPLSAANFLGTYEIETGNDGLVSLCGSLCCLLGSSCCLFALSSCCSFCSLSSSCIFCSLCSSSCLLACGNCCLFSNCCFLSSSCCCLSSLCCLLRSSCCCLGLSSLCCLFNCCLNCGLGELYFESSANACCLIHLSSVECECDIRILLYYCLEVVAVVNELVLSVCVSIAVFLNAPAIVPFAVSCEFPLITFSVSLNVLECNCINAVFLSHNVSRISGVPTVTAAKTSFANYC